MSQISGGQPLYPNIEKLIDSEHFDELNRSFTLAYQELEKMAKVKKGLKVQKEARKAMQAFEKVVELLKELLKVKYRLQEEVAKREKKGG